MKSILAIILLVISISAEAQIGGTYTYEWLGSPTSSRLTALGGSLITIQDDDLALGFNNPALLNTETARKLSINHNFSFAGVSDGYFGYGHSIDSTLNLSFGVGYASYGEFTLADELGNTAGTFTGSEAAVIIGASKRLNERITVGANIKGIFGSVETYSSTGAALDIGLLYQKPDALWAVAFLAKNIGLELSSYGEEPASAPLDIQIGFSQRLRYLPFRFSILLHNLHRYGIRYDDPNRAIETDIFGNPINQPSSFSEGLDNMFRHIVVGGEFLLGKKGNFRLRVGYNHLRRQELSVSSFRSLAGFSAGFGLRIKGIRLDYGLGYHHISGAANHLSISMGLDRFFKKA